MSGHSESFAVPEALIERRGDGSAVISNAIGLPEVSETVIDRLDHWAATDADRVFLTQREGKARRSESYAGFSAMTFDAAVLLERGGTIRGDRIVIVAENGIDHAAMILGSMRAGVIPSTISPSLLRSEEGRSRLRAMLDLISPSRIFVGGESASESSGEGPFQFEPLPKLSTSAGHRGRETGKPELQYPAKLLFTSGSTGTSKAVVNTHLMLSSNMVALREVWPLLKTTPPIMVDWLPWSHTFGANFCFNIALWNGGCFHIDDGKPVPGLVEQSWAAIKELKPNIYFNVPAGFAMLMPQMKRDPEGAAQFLGTLDFIFNAGAALPPVVRAELEQLALETTGRVPPIVGAWGSTETAPASTVVYFPSEYSANLGLPMPGTEVKLVPHAGVTELRVRGPNVFKEYLGDAEASTSAFDEEGFYRIGDAGFLIDEDNPSAGLAFDGRVAENFKLSSGTWVNVGPLRLALVSACAPHVRDLVVLGEGERDISLLLFENAEMDASVEDRHEAVLGALAQHNANQLGSSTKAARFAWAVSPPEPGTEMTDKGYLNQRGVIRNRPEEVAQAMQSGYTIS